MIKFTCTNCGNSHEISQLEIKYENVGINERQMGTETEYLGHYEKNCKYCDNLMIMEFNFWEYPKMALNYSEFNQEGCIITEEPDYQSIITNLENPENE